MRITDELADKLEQRVSEHLSKCFFPDRMSIDTADVQEAIEHLRAYSHREQRLRREYKRDEVVHFTSSRAIDTK